MTQYKRRNPFDEYGNEDLINVYLLSVVEAKALKIWGSYEKLNFEKEKRKLEYEKRRQQVFNLKKSLRDYQNKLDHLENAYNENQYVSFISYPGREKKQKFVYLLVQIILLSFSKFKNLKKEKLIKNI